MDHERVSEVASGRRGGAEILKNFSSITGKEVYKPGFDATPIIRPTFDVFVVISHDKSHRRGYRVRTAYPTNRSR